MGDIKAQIRRFRIGAKIRGLRQQKRLTLQELSAFERRNIIQKPLTAEQKHAGHYCVLGTIGEPSDW